jgi:hypothetical protein
MKVRKLTPTEELKFKIERLEEMNSSLFTENEVLKAQNALNKQFFDLHFKQGIPSLIKALRVVTYSMVTKDKKSY